MAGKTQAYLPCSQDTYPGWRLWDDGGRRSRLWQLFSKGELCRLQDTCVSTPHQTRSSVLQVEGNVSHLI